MSADAIARHPAQWFDGVTAEARAAVLVVDRDALHVSAADRFSDYPLRALQLSAPVAGVPLRIGLPDGGVLVVEGDAEALARLLPAPPQGFAHRLEHNLAMVACALAGIAVAAFFGWRDGIPWLAAKVAMRVPMAAEAELGRATLATLDRFAFKPSRLPEADRQQVEAAFARLAQAATMPRPPELLFRRGGMIGANALALPGGTIVVTDQLVQEVGSVEATAAVLAHEIGHEARRHALQQLIAGSATALVFGALLGDVSGVGSLAAAAPGTLLRLHYSRGAEDEADRYAYDLLRRAGSSPALLGDALEALQRRSCAKGRAGEDEEDAADEQSDEDEDKDAGGNADAGSDGKGADGKGADAKGAAAGSADAKDVGEKGTGEQSVDAKAPDAKSPNAKSPGATGADRDGTDCKVDERSPGYFSTHPGIGERIRNARAAARR